MAESFNDEHKEDPLPRSSTEDGSPVKMSGSQKQFIDNNLGASDFGFINGDFATAGIFQELKLVDDDDVCDAIAVSPGPKPKLLAMGGQGHVDLWACDDDCAAFRKVRSVPQSDRVSSLCWMSVGGDHADSTTLLAVGGLDGAVSIYQVPADLEEDDLDLLFELSVPGTVRALDYYFAPRRSKEDAEQPSSASSSSSKSSPSVLILLVADESGQVTVISLDTVTLKPIGGEPQIMLNPSPTRTLLGLSICRRLGAVATCTQQGDVAVYDLNEVFTSYVEDQEPLYSTTRPGAVRGIEFSLDGTRLAFGGYDKTVVLVDTNLWTSYRELPLQGTVNVVAFDPLDRYLAVGCRDKSLALLDTSTYVAVKRIVTPGWVTSISWGGGPSNDDDDDTSRDVLAVRTDKQKVSLLDLTPIHVVTNSPFGGSKPTDASSPSKETESSVSWHVNSRWVARVVASSVVIADAHQEFVDVAFLTDAAALRRVVFCRAKGMEDLLATVSVEGVLRVLRLVRDAWDMVRLESVEMVKVESELKAVAWSNDGLIATGGTEKFLSIFHSKDLTPKFEPIQLPGRIWGIDFCRGLTTDDNSKFVAVALGDYTTVFMNESFQPLLRVVRNRTMRCLKFHPALPVVVMGDGAATVAIVDYDEEQVVQELDVGGRVNALDFSSTGGYLIVGTDGAKFSLLETSTYKCVQEVTCSGFALTAEFAPDGSHLALGSSDGSYTLMRLGPFLGTELIPLRGVKELPGFALNEALNRSPSNGPSFVQRLMIDGRSECLQQVTTILHDNPDAVYTFDRETKESCFETAMLLEKPNLLKLMVTKLVDGTLDSSADGQKSIVTTGIPELGRTALFDIISTCPADFVIDILSKTTFMRVPFTSSHLVDPAARMSCGSSSFMDPWVTSAPQLSSNLLERSKSTRSMSENAEGQVKRTPAVLPLPGLGDMDFLNALLDQSEPEVFDNDAMETVLRVLWRDHIKRYFLLDWLVFLVFYIMWMVTMEMTISSSSVVDNPGEIFVALFTLLLNAVFTVKELIQSRFGRRSRYFHSIWNWIDIFTLASVYAYVLVVWLDGGDNASVVPLAVVASILMTMKLVSYMRGFADTGWLVSVLTANFRDVRGFLVLLFVILVGFTLCFRALFAETSDPNYGSLRRSFLSTFEMTILATYDQATLFESSYTVLAVMTFIFAVTCVLVVALNALISILADSYARVQERATANRRRGEAELICEYMSLLPPWKRRQIEKEARWFHVLLETDEDGDLLVSKDDWEGGLNALRRTMEEMTETMQENHERALKQVKADLDTEISSFKKDVFGLLEHLSEEIRELRSIQSEGQNGQGMSTSRNVAEAVKAVKSIGRKE